jgi:SAM-dependent methyltransferase
MIEHLERPSELVAEIGRVLRNDGIALIATVNKDETISPNPYHVREFTADEFEKILTSHFAAVEMYGVFGDELFMRYWRNNRQWVNNFMRLDVFNLASRIPDGLRKRLFDAASRLMRVSLRRRDPDLCSNITHENFLFRRDEFDGCLDLFTVCRKTKGKTEKRRH